MISQIMPNTKLLDEMKSRMPIGLYVNSDEVSDFLIANPLGFQTPFYILNDAHQPNEFVITGNGEYSRNLVDWYPILGGRLILQGRDKTYIRYKGDGEVVEIIESQYHYSIGGNLFSLTHKTWNAETRTTEDTSSTARGEFEQYFMNQTNLIHAKLLILALYTDARAYNQLFKGCVNLEDAPAILAEECQSATYSSFLSGCAKVTEIRCNIVTWQQYTDFSLGLPAMGKFYKRESAAIPQGKDGTPDGWEIIDVDTNHLGNQTPFWVKNLSLDDTNSLTFEGTLQYSWDAKNWDDLAGQSGTLFPQQKVFLRTKPQSGSKVKITASTMPFEVGGNLFSLTRNEWDEMTKTTREEFKDWFSNQVNLINIKGLILPSRIDFGGLNGIFQGSSVSGDISIICECSTNALINMFASTNVERIYIKIINDITSNILYRICALCNNLNSATIDALSLSNNGYVFAGAKNLKRIEIKNCNIFSGSLNWVNDISSKGVFIKSQKLEMPIGVNGIPTGWKVVNVKREEPKPFEPNPYGNATPFWIRSLEEGDNQIQLSGECQISRGKGWSECKFGRITLQKDERIFIRTMPEGVSNVKVLSSFRAFEVGGNLFSLTRDEYDESTIAEANEFEGILKGTKVKLANNLLFPLNSQNSFVEMFANSAVEEVTINNVLAYNASQDMLANCNKLKAVKYLATPYNEQLNWMHDASATGTFTKYRGVEIPTGANGIPNGWTTTEIDPPVPADA